MILGREPLGGSIIGGTTLTDLAADTGYAHLEETSKPRLLASGYPSSASAQMVETARPTLAAEGGGTLAASQLEAPTLDSTGTGQDFGTASLIDLQKPTLSARCGGYFAANLSRPTLSSTGTFNDYGVLQVNYGQTPTLSAYAAGGTIAALSVARATLSATGTANEFGYADMEEQRATLSATGIANDNGTASMRVTFESILVAHGGGLGAFTAPIPTLSSTGTHDGGVTGVTMVPARPILSASGTLDDSGYAHLTVEFAPVLNAGGGIATTYPPRPILDATGTFTTANSVAYVMNLYTAESTRYTNYDFQHLIVIGGTLYGVMSDGLYEIAGDTDSGARINGTIVTKDTDFGTYQSKRLQYAYLITDTATTLTPYVDGIKKHSHKSSFGGRKTLMSLGNQGRYWQLKIENIKLLQGIELLPAPVQRRVK